MLEVPRPPKGRGEVQLGGVEGLYWGGRRKKGKGSATNYMQNLRKRKESKMISRSWVSINEKLNNMKLMVVWKEIQKFMKGHEIRGGSELIWGRDMQGREFGKGWGYNEIESWGEPQGRPGRGHAYLLHHWGIFNPFYMPSTVLGARDMTKIKRSGTCAPWVPIGRGDRPPCSNDTDECDDKVYKSV